MYFISGFLEFCLFLPSKSENFYKTSTVKITKKLYFSTMGFSKTTTLKTKAPLLLDAIYYCYHFSKVLFQMVAYSLIFVLRHPISSSVHGSRFLTTRRVRQTEE